MINLPIPYNAVFDTRSAGEYGRYSSVAMFWNIKGCPYGQAVTVTEQTDRSVYLAEQSLLKDFWRTRGAA